MPSSRFSPTPSEAARSLEEPLRRCRRHGVLAAVVHGRPQGGGMAAETETAEGLAEDLRPMWPAPVQEPEELLTAFL